MIDRAVSGRTVVQLARIGPSQSKKLKRLRLDLRTDDQQKRCHRDGGDRHEIPDGIKRQILVKTWVDRLGPLVGHQQGIAVGCGFRDRLGADHAAGARAILDHDRLLPALAEFLSNRTRKGIGRTTGGLRHDDPDQFWSENPPRAGAMAMRPRPRQILQRANGQSS